MILEKPLIKLLKANSALPMLLQQSIKLLETRFSTSITQSSTLKFLAQRKVLVCSTMSTLIGIMQKVGRWLEMSLVSMREVICLLSIFVYK